MNMIITKKNHRKKPKTLLVLQFNFFYFKDTFLFYCAFFYFVKYQIASITVKILKYPLIPGFYFFIFIGIWIFSPCNENKNNNNNKSAAIAKMFSFFNR